MENWIKEQQLSLFTDYTEVSPILVQATILSIFIQAYATIQPATAKAIQNKYCSGTGSI
jgi:hypothetical protein